MEQDLLVGSMVVAIISMDLSRARICRPIRRLARRLHPQLGHLVDCPWCLSHWVAVLVCSFTQQPLVTGTAMLLGLAIPQMLLIGLFMWFLDHHLPSVEQGECNADV